MCLELVIEMLKSSMMLSVCMVYDYSIIYDLWLWLVYWI